MKSAFDAIKKEGYGEGKTVYFEVSPLQWGLWAAGKDTSMDEAASMIGLKNIFGDQSGWLEVSEEQVISADPDYIVTITMYYGEDVDEEDAEVVSTTFKGNFPDAEITVINGGQPVYFYMISIE